MNKDTYGTPPEVVAAMDLEFRMVADVAASASNAVCDRYLTEQDDALAISWATVAKPGEYVWCNPPYSDIGPWVEAASKAQRKGIGTVMLVMADSSVGWYRKALETCNEVREVVGGRLAFINPQTGKPAAGNNKGSLFLIWDPYGRLKAVRTHVLRDELLAIGRKALEWRAKADGVQIGGFMSIKPVTNTTWPIEVTEVLDQVLADHQDTSHSIRQRLAANINHWMLTEERQRVLDNAEHALGFYLDGLDPCTMQKLEEDAA